MSSPNFPLDDLLEPITQQEAERSIYDGLAAKEIDTTVWSAGAVVRQIIVLFAVMLAALGQLVALTVKGAFLQYAEEEWLTAVARYTYNCERIAASFAAGEVTLTNSGAGSYSYAPYEITLLNSSTGKLYKNVSAFGVDAGGTVSIVVQAVEAGQDSTALAGAIDEFSTPLIGVTCSNSSALVGRDEESDTALRARALEKLGTLSPNGSWDSYTYTAKSAVLLDSQVSCGVTRTRIDKDGFGNVWLYCATSSGGLDGTIGDRTTPLGAVDFDVQHRVTPICVAAHVEPADELVVNVQYEAFAYSTGGRTEAQIQEVIASALATWFSQRPIGGDVITTQGYLYRDRILAAIVDTLPELFHVILASPAADVALDINQVATLGTVTCTGITLVSPPEGGPS